MKFLFENWRKFINEQTSGEDLVYQGEIEPMPEMAEKFKKERKEIYDSYESGVNKKAFVAPNGLLRRRLFPNAPQRVIEAYYNWHVLPQIQKAIFTVPVVLTMHQKKCVQQSKILEFIITKELSGTPTGLEWALILLSMKWVMPLIMVLS